MQHLDDKSIEELRIGIDILTAEKIIIDYQNGWLNRNEAIQLLNKRLHTDLFVALLFQAMGSFRWPFEQQTDAMIINDLWWLQGILFCELVGKELRL